MYDLKFVNFPEGQPLNSGQSKGSRRVLEQQQKKNRGGALFHLNCAIRWGFIFNSSYFDSDLKLNFVGSFRNHRVGCTPQKMRYTACLMSTWLLCEPGCINIGNANISRRKHSLPNTQLTTTFSTLFLLTETQLHFIRTNKISHHDFYF